MRPETARRAGRRRRITAPWVLGGIGLLVLVVVALGGTTARGAQPVDITPDHPPGLLTIQWAGDTFVGDAALPYLQQHGYQWVFDGLRDVLAADVIIINAEAPITDIDEPFTPNKLYSYVSPPAAAQAMADAGVDVLGLANNHALDQGALGLEDTFRHASNAGMVAFGAGRDAREAERPLIIRGQGVNVGVVGLAKGYGTRLTAGVGRAGTVPFSTASINRGYALARAAGADYVVGFVHWGENYRPEPVSDQLRDAAKFAAAGYDLVIGHGPHLTQRIDVVDGMPVLHSLGNFVFGTPGSYTEELPGVGLLVNTGFGPNGLETVQITCLDIDNKRVEYQARPCDGATAQAALGNLGVPVVVTDATATIRLPTR
jgi:poly-gamma-glutamate capsule biosynthesis protein CapA/YwtB (metallophosphatase superfamily)